METKSFTTRDLAALLHVEQATVRRSFCVNGHYLGLRPVKLPNNRLLWPKDETIRLLDGGDHERN